MKTELTKKKELSEKECKKLSNELQQKIIHRKELEAIAIKLTAQLEKTSKEKQELVQEHAHNQQLIAEYNYDVKELKKELENMKKVITNTFDDDFLGASNI